MNENEHGTSIKLYTVLVNTNELVVAEVLDAI